MKIFYSPSTEGFYHSEIHGDGIPSDAVKISQGEYVYLLDGKLNAKKIVVSPSGKLFIDEPAALPTTEQQIAKYEAALDAHLDTVAVSHRWFSRVTFAVRAGYPNPWREQAIAFGTWMDSCNSQAYRLLEDVLAGNAELPTVEEFIAALPPFVLP